MTQLTTWRPLGAAATPFTDVPLFNDMARRLLTDLMAPTAPLTWQPRADVIETPEAYLVRLELAGLRAADLKVTVAGDTLTVQGEKREERRAEGDVVYAQECAYGPFLRTFTFPAAIDAEGVNAASEDGVLAITVAKAPEAKAKRIPIHRAIAATAVVKK